MRLSGTGTFDLTQSSREKSELIAVCINAGGPSFIHEGDVESAAWAIPDRVLNGDLDEGNAAEQLYDDLRLLFAPVHYLLPNAVIDIIGCSHEL